ncbi:MAG: hypothetical protein ACI9YL_001246 [Luteibaculaceae bacterium]|jgi:hypothetical protein
MKKGIKKLCLLFGFLSFTLCSCSKSKTSPAGVWQYSGFYKGNATLDLLESDWLVIQTDGTFWYRLSEVKRYATGNWQFNDSSLVLYYDSIPSQIGVDSIHLNGDQREYYFNGQIIHRLENGKRISRTFKSTFLSDSVWRFTEGNLKFEFIKLAL